VVIPPPLISGKILHIRITVKKCSIFFVASKGFGCYLGGVVVLKLLLSLGFLIFTALVLSLISRTNSLQRQAARLLEVLKQAEESENALNSAIVAASASPKTPKPQ
jgi:hypothetical protein